jgi:hypothetical protein
LAGASDSSSSGKWSAGKRRRGDIEGVSKMHKEGGIRLGGDHVLNNAQLVD